MCEKRRGAVVLIRAGDPEISGALAAGVMEGREKRRDDLSRRCAPPSPEGEGSTTAARRAVAAGTDSREVAKLVRVAVGNTKTAEDYMILRAAAEQEYRVRRAGGPMGRLAKALLSAYALAVYQIHRFFRWEESRWREG